MAPAHGHRQKKGRLFELRQDHYTASIILPVFLRAWVSVSLVPGRSLFIRCRRSLVDLTAYGRVQE